MNILVTGATGFYGAHFAKYCLEQGDKVFSIVHKQMGSYKRNDLSTPTYLGIFDKIHWEYGDIREWGFIDPFLSRLEIDAVAHFAAANFLRNNKKEYSDCVWPTNVNGTVNVLEAVDFALHFNNKKIKTLFISSDKVYANGGPCYECDELRGETPYELSKIAGEMACKSYLQRGLDIRVSRSCNVIGPADLSSRLVPNTIKAFIKGDVVQVYNKMQYSREYVHVDDAVRAQYSILTNDGFDGMIFNIGSGEPRSQKQIIDYIRKTHFPDGKIEKVEPPANHLMEIPPQNLDAKLTRAILGWTPQKTVESAIDETVEFWLKHKEII